MLITIKQIERIERDLIVNFLCSTGNGKGIWFSDLDPIIESNYSVEFDFDDGLKLGREVNIINTSSFSISSSNEITNIIALVDSIDTDDMLFLKLSADSVTMLELNDIGNIAISDFLEIKIPANCLKITPIGI